MRFSDFQLFFILHIYHICSNKGNYIKIRPNNSTFPLSLGNVIDEIGAVFNELHFSPQYTTIVSSGVNMEDYKTLPDLFKEEQYYRTEDSQEFKKLSYIIAHSKVFLRCINSVTSNYANKDWGILLYFDDDCIQILPALIKHFLHEYTNSYIQSHAKNNYEFTRTEDRRLSKLIKGGVGTLDIDFKNNGEKNGIFTIFLAHWLESQMSIIDFQADINFPYTLNFRSRIEYHDEMNKPTISVKINDGKVIVNGRIALQDKDYERASDIMKFILSKDSLPIPQVTELYLMLYNPYDGKVSPKERKNLKEKLTRMSKEILEHTGFKIFKAGRTVVTFNPEVNIVLE